MASDSDKELKQIVVSLIKTVGMLAERQKTHQSMIDGAAAMLSKHATLLLAQIPQCTSCNEPATLEDIRFSGVRFCDHCAAAEIVEGRRNAVFFTEVANVVEIRDAVDYVKITDSLGGILH